jgi:hypothetical protein
MSKEEKKFAMYLTVLRFLAFKITPNLKRIYIDFDMQLHEIILTAVYQSSPTDLDLELLDDIVTNSDAHIPDFSVEERIILTEHLTGLEKHDFIAFATHDEA